MVKSKNILWEIAKIPEEHEKKRQEFLELGYTHMADTYHIAKWELVKLYGKKKYKRSHFYELISNPESFEAIRDEYLSTLRKDFLSKYHVANRVTQKVFGAKKRKKSEEVKIYQTPVPHVRYWE